MIDLKELAAMVESTEFAAASCDQEPHFYARVGRVVLDAPRVWWCGIEGEALTDVHNCVNKWGHPTKHDLGCGWRLLVPVKGEA